MDEAERNVIEVLENLKRHYMEAAKPYLEKLAQLRALRPGPFFLTHDLGRPDGDHTVFCLAETQEDGSIKVLEVGEEKLLDSAKTPD